MLIDSDWHFSSELRIRWNGSGLASASNPQTSNWLFLPPTHTHTHWQYSSSSWSQPSIEQSRSVCLPTAAGLLTTKNIWHVQRTRGKPFRQTKKGPNLLYNTLMLYWFSQAFSGAWRTQNVWLPPGNMHLHFWNMHFLHLYHVPPVLWGPKWCKCPDSNFLHCYLGP